MKVRIEANHPIATKDGFKPWDDKERQIESHVYSDVHELGTWLTGQTRIAFSYRPGSSRVIDGVPHFFPRRAITGVHCIRVVRCP